MTQDRIQSETGKAYFSQIPHILFDYDLSPYAFKLWCHYNKVGTCWQSVRTTADNCNMSVGAVVKYRNELQEKKLITVSDNQYGGYNIQVTDLWPENMQKYANHGRSQNEHAQQERSPREQERSPREPNNNPTITIQEEESAPPPAKPKPKHIANMEAMEQSASLSPHVKALADAIVDVTSSLSITQNIIDVAYTLNGWDATPELVRELFSGAGCYWLTEGAGAWHDGNGRVYPKNIVNDWHWALQWKENHTSGGAWAELYAKHIAPLQSVDGAELKERVRLLPFDIKERLSEIGVKQAGQIARLSLAQFAGGA